MQVLKVVLYIIMTLSAVGLIIVILLQPGQSGAGALTGETEAAYAKNKTRSKEQRLAKYTKIVAAVMFVLSFTIALLEKLF
jgi:protein translocase SecG subunit